MSDEHRPSVSGVKSSAKTARRRGRLEPTSNNVVVRFSSDALKRIYNMPLETARKDYALMLGASGVELSDGEQSAD